MQRGLVGSEMCIRDRAMSMLQFLKGWSDAELEKETASMKTSFAESCRGLVKIRKIKIPELGEKANFGIMRIIARCLEYSPCMRLNMEDVLASLICPNEEFCWILDSLSTPKKDRYTQEIHRYFQQSGVLTSIPQKEKLHVKKKKKKKKKKKSTLR
eukprot:TRINITY_DN6824_c0_g1_i4.p1 TRINITY_DN6824_c0_g1~~TRINITY_DN6824_c0_g1_i4.p1  ORF type:complete len:156 (-),score=36.70 TRINITY_DN6824_c0_g1_i4:3-470(-)